jgi:Transglutaminase-like superfamily
VKRKTMRRLYTREAAVLLALARLAVRLLPATRIIAWASRAPRRINRFAVSEAAAVSWAVDHVGAKRWMNAACLPRALAAQAMLRRRGVASRLCLGVAHEGQQLAAHAWIELGQDMITGGAEAPRFTRLVEFGGERR